MGIRVYIAGPYTRPDPVYNTHRAIQAADQLAGAGLVPYIPHLTLFWHYHSPKPYEWWLEYDMNWVDQCQCILRLCGESSGADKEVDHARLMGMPVFYSVEEVLRWAKSTASRTPSGPSAPLGSQVS